MLDIFYVKLIKKGQKMAGILCIQINSVMNDKTSNLNKVENLLEQNKDKQLDMVLVPEFFSTNIAYEKYPEDEKGGQTIEKMCEFARKYNTNIVAGSVVRRVEDKYYNTSFAINRQGEIIASYDKIHLYNYMGGNEGAFTSEGNKIVTVDFDFAKVGLAICFDVRYPLHFNKLLKENVDIITLPTARLIPAEVYENQNALDNAKTMWYALNRTRAYDNLVYMVVSNQCGHVNNQLLALGNSMILAPNAEVISSIDDKEGAIYSQIDIQYVKLMRSIYPIAKID